MTSKVGLIVIVVCCLFAMGAQAAFEYRYVEAEDYSATEGGGLREEGFTSWMRHPSHKKVMVMFGSAFLEYDVKGLGEGPYHVFVRGLAWASGADVDILWDGKKVGRASYPIPGTALKWSREVGVVQGRGDHKLRVANEPQNTQAPYVDVVLLTTQTGYQPSDADADFETFTTPLPLLQLNTPKAVETVISEPGAQQSDPVDIELVAAQAGPLGIGGNPMVLQVKNLKNASRQLEVFARLGQGEESRAAVTIPADASQDLRLTCDAPTPGRMALSLRVMEGDRALMTGSYKVKVPDPASVSLDEYAYPLGTKQVTWKASFSAQPEVIRETSISVALLRVGEAKPVAQQGLTGAAPTSEASFATANLKPGRYCMTAQFNRRGKLMLKDTHEFIIFRPTPLEVWEPVKRTEPKGDVILMNGKPFLGKLLYHAAPDEKTRNQGFNLVQCYGGDPDPRESIKKHLDQCAETGLWGTVALFNNQFLLKDGQFNLANLRATVQQFKDHPALWGWDLVDEPDGANIPPDKVAEAARLIREVDPNHIVWVNLCRPDPDTTYLSSQDLWSFDFYPLPTLGPFAYMQWIKISDEKLRGKHPLGSVLQTYAYGGSRMPTPDELRNIAYLHLIHDYKWLGYYSYFDPEPDGCLARDPVLWSYARALNSELRALSAVILDPAPFENVKADAGPDVFQAAMKKVKGERFLIAVSGSSKPLQVKMQVTGKTAKLLFEDERAAALKGGVLSDEFSSYGVHVYVIR